MGVLLVVLLLVLACMLLLADYTLQKGRARHLRVHTAGIRQQMADLSFKRSQMKSNVMVTVKHNNVVAWTWTRKSRCFMYDNVEPSKELYETKVVTEEQFFDIYFSDFPRHKALFQEFIEKRHEGPADAVHWFFPASGKYAGIWTDINETVLERDADGRATVIRGFTTFVSQNSGMQPLSVLSIRNQREQATKQAFLANSYWESDAVVNPLLTAVGTIRDATSSEVEQQQLTVLERHVSDILRMLGNTMLQVKIEGGLWDFGQQDTNLDELIYGIYGHMSDEYKERYPDVELRLGDRGRTKDVKVDARVARTALACIIDNAMKFTDKGSVTIGYADSQLHDVPSVCFYVEDTGIGIAPEQQGVIFGRYVKLDNRIHGMGIGLYASQQLVGKAGGAIGVKSSPGQGTRMTVELPIGPADLLSI